MDYRLTIKISFTTVLVGLAVSSSCILAIYLCRKECTIYITIFETKRLFDNFSSHMTIPLSTSMKSSKQRTYVCLEYERFCKTSLYHINAELYDMSALILVALIKES